MPFIVPKSALHCPVTLQAGIKVIRKILSGKFDKYPDLQVISGHWGEMVPFYL